MNSHIEVFLKVVINISEKILIQFAPDELISKIKETNTFANPKYEFNQQLGYGNWQTSHYHDDGSICMPIGFLPDLLKLCEECNVNPIIEDLRSTHPITFPDLKRIILRPYQERAVSQTMQSDQGTIIGPTGSGKSFIGLEIIRQRGQKALIIVQCGELAKQWATVIKEHMGIKAGFIGDGEWLIGDQITIAMVQTLRLVKMKLRLYQMPLV